MDFYDSIFQYDLEIQNKLTERLNTFFKSINLLKNESLIIQPNNTESKYKHINYVINEINSSQKFKSKLLLNLKKQLLLRMNNKTKNKNKINSKYYIYAKDMNKDNKNIDIIEIENNVNKKESNINIDKFKHGLQLKNCFYQKSIYYEQNNENEKEDIIGEKYLIKVQSDINKIVCDIIKQNIKNIYNQKLNEISLNNNKDKNIENSNNYDNNNNINNNIKNNNYIKIPKKNTYFQEIKHGKENKKLHNNHSTEKNINYINFFKDNKNITKELRNSVANNNGNHLKIKVNKNDILNFNNINNNNKNNLLINKIKNLKNDNNNINNIQNNKILEKENTMKEKEQINHETENEFTNHKNKKKINNKNNCEKNKNDNKNGEQNHKKMIIRNNQKIQIKNIKLKNNPTGYNLTNICKNKLEDFENSEKMNLKKNKQKKRQCASPCEVGFSNKIINILKFKLGKNDPTPVRKHTEKNYKKNNVVDNNNVNENSIVSIISDKMKDYYHGIRFSSAKKKKINEEKSINDMSQISDPKNNNNNNNYLISNYKTNIKRNNDNLNNKNTLTKESDNDNYFIINKNNINMRKSLSKESGSNSYLPWNVDITNAIVNKSNNKGKMIESYFNHAKNNIDINLNNINEYKKRKKRSNNTHYIYSGNNLKKKENYNKKYEQKYENNPIKKKNTNNNKNIYNANNNFKENKNLVDAGYNNDTINIKDEPISYREGIKIKGKRRILSTRVHIRGVNSSKNFNNIIGNNV